MTSKSKALQLGHKIIFGTFFSHNLATAAEDPKVLIKTLIICDFGASLRAGRDIYNIIKRRAVSEIYSPDSLLAAVWEK